MPAYVVRNGLSDGHGLPARTATIGRATQMPIQNRTAGIGLMSPTTTPTTIAPYHHTSPRMRSAVRMMPATPMSIGRVG